MLAVGLAIVFKIGKIVFTNKQIKLKVECLFSYLCFIFNWTNPSAWISAEVILMFLQVVNL